MPGKAARRATGPAALVLFLFLAPRPAAAARHRKSPHVEVEATAVVETAPKRKTHRNGRAFEEFDVRIAAARAVSGDRSADSSADIDAAGRVHVVHDLSCGGRWVDLSAGQRVSLRGEYVDVPGGRDIIHFTHPADRRCGRAGGHPDGYLRAE